MTVAINQKPIFTKSGVFNTGQTILAANTAKDGTGAVVTVFDPQRTITSLVSSGTTATATTTLPHGFLNGEQILISGANEDGYNGVQTITLVGPKTFTYTVSAGLSSPATGTLLSDPINGQRIIKLVFQPLGSNVASAGRAFLNNGQSSAVAANNTYLDDVTLPISTLSEVATMPGIDMVLDLVVPPFHKINVALGTAVAAGYAVYAVAGNY